MKHFLLTAGASAVMALTYVASGFAAAPETTSPPTIDGAPIVGRTLTAGNGLWRNSPDTFSYRWMRCDAKGNDCNRIGGAAEKTYDLVSADVGRTIIVLVTARNNDGAQTANSHPTDVVTKAIAPTSKSAPTITGKAVVGAQLVADAGNYPGAPSRPTCSSGDAATRQAVAVSTSPEPPAKPTAYEDADVGHTLRVEVTAKNDYGSTVNESKPTAVVQTATVPAVTTTVTASRTSTICCTRTVRLTGHVSSNKGGEPITVIAIEFDQDVTNTVAKTVTDASGNWSTIVKPLVETTYTAQTSTSKGQPIQVTVHPRVGFGISGNNFSAKITGRDTFAGAVALFQVQTNAGWRTRAVIVVNTFSVARFHVNLKRGHTYTVRIYLPQRQAGPGYLDGSSHIRRVGGRFLTR